MRRAVFLTSLLLSSMPLFAGVSYHFTVKTTGISETLMSGRVEADGPRMRMDIAHGDTMLFKNDSIVISNDGGKTMNVFDPAAKTFYVLKLDAFLAGPLAAMKMIGSTFTFEHPKASTRDMGDGGTIEGFPTRHVQLDLDYDMVATMMDNALATHFKIHSEMWRTDKLDAVITPFQVKGLHTGMEAIDKLLAAYDSTGKGLPLKEVTTIETTRPETRTKSKTTSTSTVTGVEQRAIPASEFAMPSGYKEVPNPFDRMLRSIRE